MRLVQFTLVGAPAAAAGALPWYRVGVLLADGSIADVTDAAADVPPPAALSLPLRSMRLFLELGDAGRALAERAVATPAYHRPASSVRLRAPISDPEKVLCVGMNYADHCREQGQPIPVEPLLFAKFPSALLGDGDPLPMPAATRELDWEVELAIVIARPGRFIAREAAMEHVAGFTVAHDVSARDWQFKKNGGQWTIGKSFDGFAPIGPAIVTPDELGDPHNLRLRTLVNGTVMQDGNTKEMVHKTEALVSYISRYFTLKAGDVILTGTPPGVGCFRKPEPVWLKVGDVVTVEIERIGAITNRVVAEDAAGAGAGAGAGATS